MLMLLTIKMNMNKIRVLLASLPIWFFSCFNANKVTSAPPTETPVPSQPRTTFYQLKARDIHGMEVSMSGFKGKRVIVLNVASECGYTPQYADWQAFYEKNKDKYVVLGFPCNQFMGQEPGSNAEIETFCRKNYGVTFPIFEKADVKGSDKSDVYKWLTDPALNGWNSQEPSWNFCKYLIDENGKLTHFFASKIKPDSEEFILASR